VRFQIVCMEMNAAGMRDCGRGRELQGRHNLFLARRPPKKSINRELLPKVEAGSPGLFNGSFANSPILRTFLLSKIVHFSKLSLFPSPSSHRCHGSQSLGASPAGGRHGQETSQGDDEDVLQSHRRLLRHLHHRLFLKSSLRTRSTPPVLFSLPAVDGL
jgi:hypothetical protein